MQELDEEDTPKGKKGRTEKSKKSATRAATTEKEEKKRVPTFEGRKVVVPLIINNDFWMVALDPQQEEMYGSHISSFHQMLESQGWDKLLTEPFETSDDVVREFYMSIVLYLLKRTALQTPQSSLGEVIT